MNAKTSPLVMLQKEHTARQVQRSSTYILNLVIAAVLVGPAVAVQAIWERFDIWISLAAAIPALFVLLSMRIALQWDRAVVLRLGKFHGLHGPGVFWLAPFVDQVARYVDMRIRATEFYSESTLTKDTVPVNVDAICADDAPFDVEFNPFHPAADANGYVKLPNVNMAVEMADMRETNRSYEANLQIIKRTRELLSMTIDLLRNQT